MVYCYAERMGSKEFSEVKMANNWRTPSEQNWRLPGPQTPRYFVPRHNYAKCINFESPTMTYLNKMLPKIGLNLCNSQIINVNKLVPNKVDFYPDFEGISKIVQNTLQQKSDRDTSHSKPSDIITFLHNSNLQDMKEVSETTEPQKETTVTNLDNQNNLENLSIENMAMKNMSMLQQTKHGTGMVEKSNSDVKIESNSQPKKIKRRNKKQKKSKSDKHKTKSKTMYDILEDRFEDLEQDQEDVEESSPNTIIKISPSNLEMANPSCSSRLSQSIEKCWNYIQQLPPVKHIIAPKTAPEITDKTNNFVYVHNIDDGHLAIENMPKNLCEEYNSRKRIPSECDTEDSFVIFLEDDEESTISDVSQRKRDVMRQPSICESNDSFVICFGESSQSPTECFMFDDLVDRTSDSDDDSSDSESVLSRTSSESSCSNSMCKGLTDISVVDGNVSKKKVVRFDPRPPRVHRMVTWSYAYRKSRMGDWERYGRDRERFRNRIGSVREVLDAVLEKGHRERVYGERFREGGC